MLGVGGSRLQSRKFGDPWMSDGLVWEVTTGQGGSGHSVSKSCRIFGTWLGYSEIRFVSVLTLGKAL